MPVIMGGALIRNVRQPEYGGTLACVVCSKANPAQRYLLTAGHVIGVGGYARRGDAIEALSPSDGRWYKVAEFESAVKLRDTPGGVQMCDAAIARVTDNSIVADEIEGCGTPQDTSAGLFVGKRLQFRGAGSGMVTSALVHSTGNEVSITYRDVATGGTFTLDFAGQVLYGKRSGDVWDYASQERDSGALVLDQDGLAVGLHVGRTPGHYPLRASVCTPIRAVLDALNVTLPALAGLASSTMPADENAAPTLGSASAFIPAGTYAEDRSADIGLSNADVIGIKSFELIRVSLRDQLEPHNAFGGVLWQLTREGLVVDGHLDRTPGALVTVPRVWSAYRDFILNSAIEYRVPVELIVATICTESGGRADAVRIEPGWKSDALNPARVSAGLMQTLIETARDTTGNTSLDRGALFDPATSIDAGTCYISEQRSRTHLDPPLVACAYNAGSLKRNDGEANRWKLKQYPIGTGAHADRFTQWFNDCFAFFALESASLPATAPSFVNLLRRS